MEKALTFANYSLVVDGVDSIYDIGSMNGSRSGVIEEIAAAFNHKLTAKPSADNLGELIGLVGPAKELQENIGLVQEVLGTKKAAVTIARGWVKRSGLLLPVERSYIKSEEVDGPIDLALITGGVRNWMARRTARLEELSNTREVRQTFLVAGNRLMKTAEGPDVEEGMVEYDYMREVVAKQLSTMGLSATVVKAKTSIGDEVMKAGMYDIAEEVSFDMRSAQVAVVSNAGAWVQNVGQFRRVAKSTFYYPTFDTKGSQLLAVSDSFPLGTGSEPMTTHQNPFSAVGQIVRNAQELVRQPMYLSL